MKVTDAASRLGICDEDFIRWIEKEAIETQVDYTGQRTILKEVFKKYASSKDYEHAIRKSILVEKGQRKQGAKSDYTKAIDHIIRGLQYYIGKLEVIHQYYRPKINEYGYESSIMAAYLLFSRVISTLKMCCICASNRYWYWGSLLREIDEALDVARYFVILRNTEEGRKAVMDWFRLNESPGHSICRQAISKHEASVNPQYSEDDNKNLMRELYDKKSKFTHPTYQVIREVTEFEICSSEIKLKNTDYGPCEYEYKIFELVDFFKTSVLSSCQCFLLCFSELSLLKEHWSELRQIEQKLLRS